MTTSNNLPPEQIGKIVRAMQNKTANGHLAWEPWSDSTLDEEYVASTDLFRYFVGQEKDLFEDFKNIRVEVWKFNAAADNKNLLIHVEERRADRSAEFLALLNAARSSALDLEGLAQSILDDLA